MIWLPCRLIALRGEQSYPLGVLKTALYVLGYT